MKYLIKYLMPSRSYMMLLVILLPIVAACTGRDTLTASARTIDPLRQRHLVVIAKPTTPYRTIDVATPGSVVGTLSFTGTPPGDTLIQIAADQNGCAKPLVIRRLERRDGKVAHTLVWLTDVRAGRALPLARRFDLENNDCAWNPMVQGAVIDGALNVANSDPLVERAFATDISTGDTVAVAPFTDAGQMIPYDRMLRTPGVYEFSVESRPMSHAWVAVFDHPYFAMTDGDGSFSIDGVPPGAYHIRAWHPMLGVADGVVTVTPNQKASVALRW
jgi:hypothetical protein